MEPQAGQAIVAPRSGQDRGSKVQLPSQQRTKSRDRLGAGDSHTGQGAIRHGDKTIYVAAAFLGSLVVIGAGTYFFRSDALIQPVPSEVSRSSATPRSEIRQPDPPGVASSDIDSRAAASPHSSGSLVANIPQPLVNAPPSRIGEGQPPRLFGRSSSSPAFRPELSGKESGYDANQPGETRNVNAARQEFEKEKQRLTESALRSVDESCRLWEEVALEKPEGEDPAVLQQMKEKRRRVEETKQKLKLTSDLETRAQLLRELDTRLGDLDKIVRQLKATPRNIKAG